MTSRHFLRPVAVLAGLTLVLAGCASPPPVPAPVPPEVSQVPEALAPEPSSEPETPARVTVLPATCAELLPLETLHRYDSRIGHHSEGADAEPWLRQMLGPKTWETLNSGEQQLYCGFGIPQSDGGAYLGVAVIGADASAELLDALRDSVFREVGGGPAPAFAREASEEHQYTALTVVDGDLLIALASRVGGVGYVWDVHSAVRG